MRKTLTCYHNQVIQELHQFHIRAILDLLISLSLYPILKRQELRLREIPWWPKIKADLDIFFFGVCFLHQTEAGLFAIYFSRYNICNVGITSDNLRKQLLRVSRDKCFIRYNKGELEWDFKGRESELWRLADRIHSLQHNLKRPILWFSNLFSSIIVIITHKLKGYQTWLKQIV